MSTRRNTGDRPVLGLFPALRGEIGGLAWTFTVCVVSGLTLAGLVVGTAAIVGTAVVEHRSPAAWIWPVLGGAVLLRAVLTWHEMDVSHSLAYRVLAALRMSLFAGYSRSTPSRRGGDGSGDRAATAMGDIEKLEFFYAHTLAQLAATGVVVLAGLTILTVVSPRMALVVLVAAALLLASTGILAGRSRTLGEQIQRTNSAVSARVVESLTGRREILGFGLEGRVLADLDKLTLASARDQARLAQVAVLAKGVRDVIGVAGAVGLFLVAMDSPGMSFALVPPLVAGAFAVLGPVADAASTLSQLHAHRASARRVLAGIAGSAEIADAPVPQPLPVGALGIEVAGVSFAYDWRVPVLTDLSLVIAPGERVAIRGVSGAGKTTLAHLLSRLWAPDRGSITLVGVDAHRTDLSEISDADFRTVVSVVDQDALLFHGTIFDNLRIGAPDATDADLRRALAQVGAADFVAAWPDGANTIIGERGTALSGGQRSRLCLARALAAQPRILILDETTANLDPAAERAVTSVVQGLPQDVTVITIAHRASTLAASGRIIDIRRPA
ncbi:ABC transporter ATP-binding protein [Cryobacterium sp. PH29-G1]|uniref:ABC transporter ATP-binding protein n=1 Tax=Cryobacterium sp. PH29-G1 TaxID=3046211 RepID=UPI0024B9702C|nr:ABC transporter ATP-binding protein [Cryobacterium sp. PH29-G1]MDJ0350243.1 ABC transporter ATP-binding protein [Cryobacterium sp. PH29-G1]